MSLVNELHQRDIPQVIDAANDGREVLLALVQVVDNPARHGRQRLGDHGGLAHSLR